MTNMFMAQVERARNFSIWHPFKYFKYRSSYKSFKKRINYGSPSFGVLWSFADFIKYAELIFMFDNVKTNGLYSSPDYVPMQNGFKIHTPDVNILVKLYSETQRVGIDISRNTGGKIKSNYTFENNQWTSEPDDYDIMLLDRVISIINNRMLWLLDWCIDKKLGKDEFNDCC